MTDITRWWFIRHAPVINTDGVIYGQLDLAADISDHRLFEPVAARLPAEAHWFATPLQRTQQTAGALQRAAGLDQTVEIEPAFIEQSFGTWQGRPRADVYAELPVRHPFWLTPADSRPPDGESFTEVVQRVGPALDMLSDIHRGRDIVCVAHGGSIRASVARALGLTPEAALQLTVDTVSLTRIDRIIPDHGPPTYRIGPLNWTP